MKKLWLCLLAAVIILPATDSFAGTVTTVGNVDLEISGELRIRWDYYNNVYDLQDHNDDSASPDWCPSVYCDDDFAYMPFRANVIFKALVTRNVDIVTNIQYIDYFGARGGSIHGYTWGPWRGNGIYGPGAGFPGWTIGGLSTVPYAINDNMQLFEAYVHIRNAWDSNWSFKLGRQTMPLGAEFLVGDDDWYDGVSFDGLRADWGNDLVDLTLFWHKLYEGFWAGVNFSGSWLDGYSDEQDGNFYGVYSTWNLTDKFGLDAYLMSINNNVGPDASMGVYDYLNYTLGVRFFSREPMGGFDWNAELAYQDNTWGNGASEMDGNGLALNSHIGYTFDNDYEPRLALALLLLTGNDDYTTDDWDGFWRMFGDTHGKWGNADLLYSSALGMWTYDITSVFGTGGGSLTPALMFSMKPADKIRCGANLVYFMPFEDEFTVSWNWDGDGINDTVDVDWNALELDAWVSYDYSEHFGLSANVSYVDVSWKETYHYSDGSSADTYYNDDYDQAWRMYVNFVAKWR